MNVWKLSNIALNLLTMINSILAITICLFILSMITFFHRGSRSVPLLLASHTCFTLLISAIMLTSMSTASFYGFLGIHLKEHANTTWCRWRGFFIHGFLCSLYDSYIVQSAYRLCRVVFYHRKQLHSFPLYSLLVPIESLFSVVSISPVIFREEVVYLPTEYYCQTPFTNIPAIMYVALRLFLLPILFIALVYICILKHVRRSNTLFTVKDYRNNKQRRRSRQNRRDLIVIKRLLLMLSVLILLGLPSIIFLTLFIITGYLIPVTYRVGWLSVSFSLVFLGYMLIQLTRPLRKTVRRVFIYSSIGRERRKPSTKRTPAQHDERLELRGI